MPTQIATRPDNTRPTPYKPCAHVFPSAPTRTWLYKAETKPETALTCPPTAELGRRALLCPPGIPSAVPTSLPIALPIWAPKSDAPVLTPPVKPPKLTPPGSTMGARRTEAQRRRVRQNCRSAYGRRVGAGGGGDRRRRRGHLARPGSGRVPTCSTFPPRAVTTIQMRP